MGLLYGFRFGKVAQHLLLTVEGGRVDEREERLLVGIRVRARIRVRRGLR